MGRAGRRTWPGLDVRDKLVVLELPDSTSFEEAYQRIRNVANAGGGMVALQVTESTTLAGPAADNPVVLPTVRIHSRPFSDLVKAGGVQIRFTARSSSRYRYELSFPSPGKVPDQLTYAVRTADLAAVRMAYHGYPPDVPPSAGAWVEALGGEIGTQWYVPALSRGERVEHFTPGTWRLPVEQVFVEDGRPLFSALSQTIRLEAGTEHRIPWNSAVIGPGFAGTTTDALGNHPWVCRQSNLLSVTLPLFSDGAGHARPPSHQYTLDTGSTELFRNGQPVASTTLPGRGVFVVDDAEYRLTAEVTRDHPWWPTSTRVSGSWTFGSEFRQGPDCRAQPLLAVRFAPLVNFDNTAPPGELSFPVTVSRQDGPPAVADLTVEISYDDGTSWLPVPLRADGPQWTATVTHPPAGFASLRARATDTGGNAVEQTVIRAYQIA